MIPVELEVYRHPWTGYGVFIHNIEGDPNIATLGGYATAQDAIDAGEEWACKNMFKVCIVTNEE
jgi:hypothetical protein